MRLVQIIQKEALTINLEDIAKYIAINQEIYFLDLKNGDIKEAYSINNIAIVRSVGSVSSLTVKGQSYIFKPNKNMSSSFVLRRSNFMGQHIRVR